MEHAVSCPKGGFPSIKQSNIWDLTANILTEICGDVCIEPEVQAITEEFLTGANQMVLTVHSLTWPRVSVEVSLNLSMPFHNNFIPVSFYYLYYLYLALYLDNTESDNKTLTFSSSSFPSSLHGVTEHTVASRYNQLHTCREKHTIHETTHTMH